jgi:hypothetical protein
VAYLGARIAKAKCLKEKSDIEALPVADGQGRFNNEAMSKNRNFTVSCDCGRQGFPSLPPL